MFKLKLVTFDLVNTLIKVRVPPALQYADVARSMGIDVTEADISKVYQTTWRQKKIDHPAYGKKHGISNREWWSDFIVRVFVAAGYKGDPAVLNKVSEALLVHYHEGRNAWEMINGSNKNLEDLKRLGLRLGVVSNSDDSTLPMLRTLGLMPFFDFVINTSNSGLEKPDPEIYRKALEAAGGVCPEDAAHVGDEVEADYTAPRKIGMLAFLLDRQQRLRNADLEGVDRQFIIHDLSKLCSLVELKQ